MYVYAVGGRGWGVLFTFYFILYIKKEGTQIDCAYVAMIYNYNVLKRMFLFTCMCVNFFIKFKKCLPKILFCLDKKRSIIFKINR